MAGKRSLVRGGITLAVLAALAGAMVIAPAGAHVTGKFGHLKKHIKKIAKNQATEVFNQNIGGATAGFLQTGSILVQAEADPDLGYSDGAGLVTINTVNITAPSAGFLIIGGQVDVDNDTGAEAFMILDVQIDGTDATPNGKAMATGTAADAAPAQDEQTLAYTIVRPISAGAHTVTQTLSGAADYDYDGNELSALFVPSGGVARTAARGTGSGSDSGNGDA